MIQLLNNDKELVVNIVELLEILAEILIVVLFIWCIYAAVFSKAAKQDWSNSLKNKRIETEPDDDHVPRSIRNSYDISDISL